MIGRANEVEDGEKTIYQHVDDDMPVKCEPRFYTRRRASIKGLVVHTSIQHVDLAMASAKCIAGESEKIPVRTGS
jgi:hypothetical protein